MKYKWNSLTFVVMAICCLLTGCKKDIAVEDAADVLHMDVEDPMYAEQLQEGEQTLNFASFALDEAKGETRDATLGIDVSKWQGLIDWQQVKEAGVEFAIIRVGYRTVETGVIFEDPYARYNLQKAQEAGIKLGAYFFSTALNEQEAQEEAAWTCAYIAQYKITYPVAYNCEGFKAENSRQYGLSNTQRTNNAIAFLDIVQAQGYTPMFYASKSELTDSNYWDTAQLESRYKIWVSQYPGTTFAESPTSTYEGAHSMWQYTSKGIVAGIDKHTDIDIAYFQYTQEAEPKDSTPYTPVEAPSDTISYTAVYEAVTAKVETNLRTVPNTESDETIVYTLKNGEYIWRTAVGSDGWSIVELNGESLYALSSYLEVVSQ